MPNRVSVIEEISRSVVSPAGKHCSNRQLEWTTTAGMLFVGMGVLIFPGALERGPFRLMGEVGFTSHSVGAVMIALAAVRGAALYANGRWQPYGAWMRAGGALFAALMWFQMLIALWGLFKATAVWPVSLPLYIALTASELFSCYRAGFDERRPRGR